MVNIQHLILYSVLVMGIIGSVGIFSILADGILLVKVLGFTGENLFPQARQLAITLLLPNVPASKPIPPVRTAPTTAFLPLKPFLSKYNCVDEHFGHFILFASIFLINITFFL